MLAELNSPCLHSHSHSLHLGMIVSSGAVWSVHCVKAFAPIFLARRCSPSLVLHLMHDQLLFTPRHAVWSLAFCNNIGSTFTNHDTCTL